jgi:hypothetical protein
MNFFVNKGLVRVAVTGKNGTEHSIYFVMENQFIADYAAYIQRKHSMYILEATEETEVVIKHLVKDQRYCRDYLLSFWWVH